MIMGACRLSSLFRHVCRVCPVLRIRGRLWSDVVRGGDQSLAAINMYLSFELFHWSPLFNSISP